MESEDNFAEVPLIDFHYLGAIQLSEISEVVRKKLAYEFVEKLKTTGYVGLENHGLSLKFVKSLNENFETFFSLPSDLKKKYNYDPETLQGYSDESYEKLDYKSDIFDAKETFDVTRLSACLFPKEVPELRDAAVEALEVLISFTKKILILMEEGLHLEAGAILNLHENVLSGFTTLRVLYYPKVPEDIPSGTIRCGEHPDKDTFTLQFQDHVGGFQIEKDGKWRNADGDPNIISLFCGKTSEKITGGRFKAAKHRVVVTKDDNVRKSARKCVALFVHPEPDAVLKDLFDPSDKGISNREWITDYVKKIHPSLQ